jgi:hypothetical protein
MRIFSEIGLAFPLLVKMPGDECGERILLGDITDDRMGMLRPIRFQCVGN